MRRIAQSRSSLADEAGFTLPELLVGMMLSLLVAFGAMSVVMAAQRAEPQTTEKAGQIQQGRFMVERLVRELRQGERVYNPAPASMELVTRAPAASCGGAGSATVACNVAYACDADSCTRSVQLAGGSWQSEEAVYGILGPNVFSYEYPEEGQPADYVAVELRFPNDSGSEAITVADGAGLRNWAEVPEAP